MERMKYQIKLLDKNGYVVGEHEADTLKEAKRRAKYMLRMR